MFEIVKNPSFWIFRHLESAISSILAFSFWRENSNVVEITKENLLFEKNLPLPFHPYVELIQNQRDEISYSSDRRGNWQV